MNNYTRIFTTLCALGGFVQCGGDLETADDVSGAGGSVGEGGSRGDGDGDDSPSGAGGAPFVPTEFAEIAGIDVLFVVDNSVSMGDKQKVLLRSVPRFIEGISELDAGGDIHIGVISSSLGGHGASLCPRVEEGWNNDDQGRLVPSLRGGAAADPEGTGFLSWNGADGAQTIENLTAQISAVGEVGCGFEAPLEAWYRFLVDPQPPLELVVDSMTKRADMATDENGVPLVDEVLLAQRAEFLRPDSLVAVVVLTDENDCSAMDGGTHYNNAGFGYLLAEASFDMPTATPECEENPNGKCCFSCLQKNSPPDGCSAIACEAKLTLPPEQDRANARCFENKRRFGIDFLYPVQRYIDALKTHTIIDARNGELVDNPLLVAHDGDVAIYRNPDYVLFTGIVGVPWQDIATEESLVDPSVHEVLAASDLSADEVMVSGKSANRWELMLGQPGLSMADQACADEGVAGCGDEPVPPLDPFMIESIAERTEGAFNPISGDLIVASTSDDPAANAINGHEANHVVVDSNKFADGSPANDDLQYACIFELETPRLDCGLEDFVCDCGDEPLRNRPLCQEPGSSSGAGKGQYYAKAYPGTRVLQVLKGAGDNAVVGSICPKPNAGSSEADANFGYNPSFERLLSEMRARLEK